MSKSPAAMMFTANLDASSGTPPLFQQLYEQVRDSILAGRLRTGARLPASRTLARDLGVSRTTVLNALEQLRAEGYVRGKVGSGTHVVSMIPGVAMRVNHPDVRTHNRRLDQQLLKRSQRRWPESSAWGLDPAARPLRPCNPDLNAFPRDLWAKLAAKYWRSIDSAFLGYGDPQGYLPLRCAIADYVNRARGVQCSPKEIVVVAGSQQALYLCAQVLIESGDIAWMEDPGYPGARAALTSAGAQIVPRPVDGEGLMLGNNGNQARPKLIYVTPSHQCPLGVTMSISRRLELLEFAARRRAWIIEDDYGSEYRFFSRPTASLRSLDRHGCTIYVGTVSKSLIPALRIGYVIAPGSLVHILARARRAIDRQPAIIDQAVLAELLAEGCFERHVRQTRIRYLERQRALVDAVRTEMPDILDITESDGAMYLIAFLTKRLSSARAARMAAAHGVEVTPLSAFSANPLARDGLVLGYRDFSVEEIRDAVKKLSCALRQT
jgi:GntR family transcriptional regulator/MocR family aminotransferase